MPLSTLGRSEWVSIMSPILQVSLHKAGVCRSFPRVVVFAPLKYPLGTHHRRRVFPDGSFSCLAGQPSGDFVTSYNWPRTRRPGPSHWDLWRRVLSQAVLRPYSRCRRLLQPLGPWSDSLDRWTWLFSRTALILFHRTDTNLAIYRPINSRSHKTFRRDLHHTWTGTLPGDVQRASVNLHPRTAYVTVTGTAPVDPPDQESMPASILHIWRELAADMDDDWGWVPEYISIEGDEQVLLEALEKSLAKPRVRVACDGIVALRQAFSTWPLSPTAPHFDLLSSIREALRVSNISWAKQHVGGHADRTKTWRQMSWWERRNSKVDDIAQGYADELIATDDTIATNPKFFSEPCAIYIDNKKVSYLALESVDEAVVLPELMEYWAAKGRLAPEDFRSVDWPIVHRAMKSLKPAEQRFITKHTVGMCAVGKFRK
ncbi:unnamed protein product [Cylindrotheca closterium]|uniref:Uncharacterized protein n=1 Tax=Cylindrotheca closterium TaxID=2856 RepID=A0AAD2CHC5_9STRA|nr:unnamed protein product [Cylindrotheca closterium]